MSCRTQRFLAVSSTNVYSSILFLFPNFPDSASKPLCRWFKYILIPALFASVKFRNSLSNALCLIGFAVLYYDVRFCFFWSMHLYFKRYVGQQLNCPGWRNKCMTAALQIDCIEESFTPASSFQGFQICPDILFLQLTVVKGIIRYNVDYRCISCCSNILNN